MTAGASGEYAGKVALITGGSAGIGLAVAKAWVQQGGRAALVARTEKSLNEAVAQLGGEEHAVSFPLDVGDLAALEELPAKVAARMGGIDLLVNNAGLHNRGPMLNLTPKQLGEMITVNLTAPVMLTRAAISHLRPGAAIVNVASLAGMVPVINAAGYCGSKAGLRAFSRAIADELEPKGIRVATVSPGPVDTGFFKDVESVSNLTFSQPMSTAEEIADAVLEAAKGGPHELAVPAISGKLCTLGYLSPALLKKLRPSMERRGAKAKLAYKEKLKNRS